MTPTSDERREMAERLRDNIHEYGTEYSFFLYALGMEREYHVPCDWTKVHERLADLIDRPTCQMKSNPISRYRVCSRCGAFVSEDAVTDCVKTIHARFCPNCGAGVVSDDDQ